MPARTSTVPGDVASRSGPATATGDGGADADRAVDVGEHAAEHVGGNRSLQHRLQVRVDRGGAEAAHDLEQHCDRDRGREAGEDLTDADDDAPADEPGHRRDVHAAVREHGEPEHEPGGDRGVEHADAEVAGAELASEERECDVVRGGEADQEEREREPAGDPMVARGSAARSRASAIQPLTCGAHFRRQRPGAGGRAVRRRRT